MITGIRLSFKFMSAVLLLLIDIHAASCKANSGYRGYAEQVAKEINDYRTEGL